MEQQTPIHPRPPNQGSSRAKGKTRYFPIFDLGEWKVLFHIILSKVYNTTHVGPNPGSRRTLLCHILEARQLLSLTSWSPWSMGQFMTRCIVCILSFLYSVFPVPLGRFTSLTDPRRTGGKRLEKTECACLTFWLGPRDPKRFGRAE